MVSCARNPQPTAAIPETSQTRAPGLRVGPGARRAMSRILMVDDADLFRALDATLVRRFQCDIVRARDAGDVLARAGTLAPDLIVLDAERPDRGGADCVRALKNDPALRDTRVLVLASGGAALDACRAAGADAALARPLIAADLEIALGKLGGLAWRRAPRRASRLAARIRSGSVHARGRIKDISRDGLFLAVRCTPAVDAEVRVLFGLPSADGVRSIDTRGVVVRRVEDDPESHLIAGVGLRFVDLSGADADWIGDYVGTGIESGENGPATGDVR